MRVTGPSPVTATGALPFQSGEWHTLSYPGSAFHHDTIRMSDDGQEIVVVGSIKELEELSGEKVSDLHRDKIDHITIPSKEGRGVLRRVDEVFDCWFESGSMPYAQVLAARYS